MAVLTPLLVSVFLSTATPAIPPGEVVDDPQAVVATPVEPAESEVHLDIPQGFGLGVQLSEKLQVDMQGMADDAEHGIFFGVSILF